MPKKILLVTPRFPLPDAGACEQDRLEGMKQLKRLGFDVRVFAKAFQFQDRGSIARFSRDSGIPVELVGYEREKKRSWSGGAYFYLRRLFWPPYWDGAAYEYSHPETRSRFVRVLREWRPDAVWFDYTYLWPLYSVVRKMRIPVVTRSLNFEPVHFLQEDGRTFVNVIKSLPKFLSEWLTVRKSDWLFAITPREEAIYRRMGARRASTLPLRSLPKYLSENRTIHDERPLHVFFAGSTYTVSHNREALEFIVRKIAPELERHAPGAFIFHITGNKVPSDTAHDIRGPVRHDGFVEDWESFTDRMDIALVPSLFGAGMQQKIFEPLSRGIPTVTSSRGLADYPFRGDESVLLAETPDEFVGCLLRLRDIGLREKLSKNALLLSNQLFSRMKLDAIIGAGFDGIFTHPERARI
ncbi:MAG: glycosyltransferase [Candidatus Niyogibacteria bacterium]|nr:glycosyltransferase [Candidatus Niyogibacteria bacterium]